MTKAKAPKKLVPEADLESAARLKKPLATSPSAADSAAMMVMMISTFGMQRAEPIFSWAAWFILLSMVINRKRGPTPISQSVMSLVITTISLAMLYYRMKRGSLPVRK